MDGFHDYSVRVQLLNKTKYGYGRLKREMNRVGFRQMFKSSGGCWVQLPRGSFHITTALTFEMVKRVATELAISIDPTALVSTNQGVDWNN